MSQLPPTPFDAFEPTTSSAWRRQVEQGLGGRSITDALAQKLPSGIAVEPLYGPAAAAAPSSGRRAVAGGWVTAQVLPGPDVASARAALESELSSGSEGFWLRLDRAARAGVGVGSEAFLQSAGVGGVALHRPDDVAQLLRGVDLSILELWLEGGASAPALAGAVLRHARTEGLDRSRLRGCLGFDPLGTLARFGSLPHPLAAQWDAAADFVMFVASLRGDDDQQPSQLATLLANARPVHGAGGDRVQELAFALASAVEALRELHQRGIALHLGASQLCFAYAVDGDLFPEIAKLRAARWLWARALDALGLDPAELPARVHVSTSPRTVTEFDAGNNPVRATVEAFAAVIGGADAVSVGALDSGVVRTGRRSRADAKAATGAESAGVLELDQRLAGNVQRVLRDESRLDAVADPAAGSGAVEALTEGLARRAWELFQEIESEGGMAAALLSGSFPRRVAERAQRRREHLAHRRTPVVGVSLFPRPEDTVPAATEGLGEDRALELTEDLGCAPSPVDGTGLDALAHNLGADVPLGAAAGAYFRGFRHAGQTSPQIEPEAAEVFAPVRDGEAFEALRHLAAAADVPPKALLVLLGPTGDHRPRQGFAESFFGAGGFALESTEPLIGESWSDDDLVARLAEAWRRAGAAAAVDAICFCGTDATYAAAVPGLARRLKSLGARRLLVAGAPGEAEQAFRDAGVDGFIHLRTDALAMLGELLAPPSSPFGARRGG